MVNTEARCLIHGCLSMNRVIHQHITKLKWVVQYFLHLWTTSNGHSNEDITVPTPLVIISLLFMEYIHMSFTLKSFIHLYSVSWSYPFLALSNSLQDPPITAPSTAARLPLYYLVINMFNLLYKISAIHMLLGVVLSTATCLTVTINSPECDSSSPRNQQLAIAAQIGLGLRSPQPSMMDF